MVKWVRLNVLLRPAFIFGLSKLWGGVSLLYSSKIALPSRHFYELVLLERFGTQKLHK